MVQSLERLGIFRLPGGGLVRIVPALPSDRQRILRFLCGLSEESRYMRFLSAGVDLESESAILTDVDGVDRFALMAATPSGAEVIGHGCYERVDPFRAEAAVVVADAYRRRGIGTLLLTHLAEVAASHGIVTFDGLAVPENHAIVACVRKGFNGTVRSGDGWMRMTFPTHLAPREDVAAAA